METFGAWKRASTIPLQEIKSANYVWFLIIYNSHHSDCLDLHNVITGQINFAVTVAVCVIFTFVKKYFPLAMEVL